MESVLVVSEMPDEEAHDASNDHTRQQLPAAQEVKGNTKAFGVLRRRCLRTAVEGVEETHIGRCSCESHRYLSMLFAGPRKAAQSDE